MRRAKAEAERETELPGQGSVPGAGVLKEDNVFTETPQAASRGA